MTAMLKPDPPFIELHSGVDVDSYVIIVPGLGRQPDIEWGHGVTGAWIKALAASSKRSRVLLYAHKLGSPHFFSWQSLFSSSNDLINALVQYQDGHLQFPVIFICHSLGGIIVKQALWAACQQDNYRILEQLTRGLIFLGTPHAQSQDELRWRALMSALRPRIKNSVRCAPSRDEVAQLARISSQFEEINSNISILSVYETLETRLSDRSLFASKSALLVGRGLSLMHAKHEDALGLESDYHGICHFNVNSPAFRRISAFMRSAFKDYSPNPLSIGGTKRSNQPSELSIKADFSKSREGPRLPRRDLQSRVQNTRFYGRSDVLEKLVAALLPSDSEGVSQKQAIKTFALCGLGGVGKTEIAVEFVYRYQEKYDAVFWLQADDLSKLAEEFGKIAVTLGLEDVDEAFDQSVSRNLVKEWLARPTKSSDPNSCERVTWLLIFDNVQDPDTLKDFWPASGNGSILLTSRDPTAKNHEFASVASGDDIKPFSSDMAAHFLMKLANPQGEEDDKKLLEEATKIAKKLDGLPLALTQMAGIMVRRAISFREFLDDYDDGKLQEFHRLQMGPQIRGYTHNLASVWAFEKLPLGPAALLDVISVLDSGPIGEDVLRAGAAGVCLEGYPRTRTEYQDARAVLVHSSLVTKNSRSSSLLVHRLTQHVARFRMSPSRFQEAFEAAVRLVSEVWPQESFHKHKRYDATLWRERESILPHCRRLRKFYMKRQPNQEFLGTPAFGWMLSNVAWYFHERGKSEDSDDTSFAALAQSIAELQPCQTDEVRRLLIAIHYCRGAEASHYNQPEACLQHFKSLLRLCQQAYVESGEMDENLASAYNEVGVGYMMNKMYDEEGYSKVMTGFPSANLGLAHMYLGELDEATEILHAALRDQEDTFGQNDIESEKTGRILHALGDVHAQRGQLELSFKYHERALEQFRKTVGHSHHRIADVCVKMAGHYMRMGKLDSTRKVLEQALRVYRGRKGLKQELSRTSFKMAKLLLLSPGKKEEAVRFLDEAWNAYVELMPKGKRRREDLEDADFDDLVSFWT